MAMSSKLRQRPRSVNGTQPLRLPTDLPPRKPTTGSNAQLQCLEQHQEHLHKIQQWQEKRNQEQERQEDSSEKQVSTELKQEQEAEELEKQRRNLLELQLKQQEQELKQRQQIMQWQQELEQQQQEQKKHKVHTPVLLSPTSGLCTIYETVETSDLEEEGQEKSGKTEEAEHENVEMLRNCDEKHKDVLYPPCTTPTVESQQKELEETDVASDLPSPPQSPSESPEGPTPIEFDWGKKADIVHHLIKQTLMLKGDSYSPLLLLPGGAGGTLSPLETSLWPNLLPPLTPTSATVTSVSSFSPEAQGSSSQGEWTVVELETHH